MPETSTAPQIHLDTVAVAKDDPRYAQLLQAVQEASVLIGAPLPATPAAQAALPGGVSKSLDEFHTHPGMADGRRSAPFFNS